MSDSAAYDTIADDLDAAAATDPAVATEPAEEAAEHTNGTTPRKSRSELVAEVKALRAEVARLRSGEEPVAPHHAMTTGGHLLWVLGHVTAEMRNNLASILIRSMSAANRCAEEDHATRLGIHRQRLEVYRQAVEHARAEAKRLDQTSGPEGRAVAMAITYALLPAEQ